MELSKQIHLTRRPSLNSHYKICVLNPRPQQSCIYSFIYTFFAESPALFLTYSFFMPANQRKYFHHASSACQFMEFPMQMPQQLKLDLLPACEVSQKGTARLNVDITFY